MLKKRIISCLDIKDGRTVKGINFVELRDAGDAVELARRYVLEGADELVFLDITATVENRKTLTELVRRVAAEINIPFTVGGGISSLEDAQAIIRAGADKVSLNSSAVDHRDRLTVWESVRCAGHRHQAGRWGVDGLCAWRKDPYPAPHARLGTGRRETRCRRDTAHLDEQRWHQGWFRDRYHPQR